MKSDNKDEFLRGKKWKTSFKICLENKIRSFPEVRYCVCLIVPSSEALFDGNMLGWIGSKPASVLLSVFIQCSILEIQRALSQRQTLWKITDLQP